jgi:hypothetical protein
VGGGSRLFFQLNLCANRSPLERNHVERTQPARDRAGRDIGQRRCAERRMGSSATGPGWSIHDRTMEWDEMVANSGSKERNRDEGSSCVLVFRRLGRDGRPSQLNNRPLQCCTGMVRRRNKNCCRRLSNRRRSIQPLCRERRQNDRWVFAVYSAFQQPAPTMPYIAYRSSSDRAPYVSALNGLPPASGFNAVDFRPCFFFSTITQSHMLDLLYAKVLKYNPVVDI